MKTITTVDTFGKRRSYEIVERIPVGFFVWNIGKNVGAPDLIPICERMHPGNKEDFTIRASTVKVIRMNPEKVQIIRKAAGYGIVSVKQARQAISRTPRTKYAARKHELAVKVLEILEPITD